MSLSTTDNSNNSERLNAGSIPAIALVLPNQTRYGRSVLERNAMYRFRCVLSRDSVTLIERVQNYTEADVLRQLTFNHISDMGIKSGFLRLIEIWNRNQQKSGEGVMTYRYAVESMP